MHLADLHALRLASEQACDAYMRAQAQLLSQIEGAYSGQNDWPMAVDYDTVHALGQSAAQALRRYLDGVGVPRAPHRSALDKMRLIQRLARSEGQWQPLPEAWLRQQEKKD